MKVGRSSALTGGRRDLFRTVRVLCLSTDVHQARRILSLDAVLLHLHRIGWRPSRGVHERIVPLRAQGRNMPSAVIERIDAKQEAPSVGVVRRQDQKLHGLDAAGTAKYMATPRMATVFANQRPPPDLRPRPGHDAYGPFVADGQGPDRVTGPPFASSPTGSSSPSPRGWRPCGAGCRWSCRLRRPNSSPRVGGLEGEDRCGRSPPPASAQGWRLLTRWLEGAVLLHRERR